MSKPLTKFADGAIPQAKTMEPKLSLLSKVHPKSTSDRMAFNSLGCEYVYAKSIPNHGNTWIVLVRFGDKLERLFGLTREIPIIYSPYRDLQLRTVDSIPQLLREHLSEDRQSATSEIAFISAPDPRLTTKLDELSKPGRTLLPLSEPTDGQELHDHILGMLHDRLWNRDPYSTRGAVTGQDFFGRDKLLQALDSHVSRGEAVGLFGMRKTGKTSLLIEFKEVKERTSHSLAVVYQDLEGLPNPHYEDPIPVLLDELVAKVRESLRHKGLRTKEITELPTEPTISEFRQALTSVIKRLRTSKLVIILDEIESLCPPGVENEKETETNQRIRQLFACFRQLTQEGQGRFSFVLAGLASASIEEGIIYGGQNPLYYWPHVYYVGPFSPQEAKTLICTIGNKVGLTWSQGAIDFAYELSGGHAMLLREIGSHVLQQANAMRRSYVKDINKTHVLDIVGPWERSVAGQLKETIGHIERYYTEEAILLETLAESPSEFAELAAEYPQQVKRLEDLGAIKLDLDDNWTLSRLVELGWKISGPSTRSRETHPHSSVPNENMDIDDLIVAGESKYLEFKASARTPMDDIKEATETHLVQEIIKTCASFMNTDGGTLLIGVRDDGVVLGIKQDIKKSNNSRDKFSLWLNNKLKQYLDESNTQLITLSFPAIDGKHICRIDVKKSISGPVWLQKGLDTISINPGYLLVRSNAECNKLSGEYTQKYIRNHWQNPQ